ncbi:hypothetical protein OKW21_004479 [Catalinimonas alkaloidigena]|uniref:hypothetical protein n=1 Tax=Catalinimonas alkaloidigena TaxID=1075417 RepID=UPI002404E105|nr:hypothetical protein [Catalinimonas alkaloidigena]MDF9799216.1 hypothetical protein [Catalinimonas alkaloidigena]
MAKKHRKTRLVDINTKRALQNCGSSWDKRFFSHLWVKRHMTRTKKIRTSWGEVVIDKAHPLAQCPNGFRISSHLQEIIA